ncbi:MAG: retropepsin-like aspartic protease [Glaciecola sp.]
MRIIKILSVLLSISLGANMFLLWQWHHHGQTNIALPNTKPINSFPSHAWSQRKLEGITTETVEQTHIQQTLQTTHNVTNQHTRFAILENLAATQQYTQLEFEISAYLRDFPNDLNALLLEAETYLHTKPLSMAILHYKDLLNLPLSDAQIADIEKLISVNTSRVIQQFSGDGAWDLLAEFLEPLLQVDPINRSYILALARAYGMQTQLNLMDNVLAALPTDDPRAQRLRENVMARLNRNNQATIDDAYIDNKSEVNARAPDLILHKDKGQFVAETVLANIRARLLVDTGASTSAISERKFLRIRPRDKSFLGQFTVNTAGGSIQAPIYKIKTFTVAGQTLKNMSVLVLPSAHLSRYDGLLGMNVLSQFDVEFDAEQATVKMFAKQ